MKHVNGHTLCIHFMYFVQHVNNRFLERTLSKNEVLENPLHKGKVLIQRKRPLKGWKHCLIPVTCLRGLILGLMMMIRHFLSKKN